MSKRRDKKRITTLIIHCAATPNGRWNTAKDIDAWHGERGFKRDPALTIHQQPELKHIGYHYLIGIKGGVESGRGEAETGAHARGYNLISIGTCLLGTDKFTYEQWAALAGHVKGIRKRYPQIKIIGHHEINSHKTCPGFDVQAWLKAGMVALPEHIILDD